MIALTLSVLLLLMAPLLARFVRSRPHFRAAFDGFVLVTVIGLVTLTLLPEALAHGGILALFIALIGLTIPWISEFLFHRAEAMTHRVVLMVASFALIVHAGTDGALLAFSDQTAEGDYVKLGILLHRAGIAVTVWWLFRSMLSSYMGIILLAALGVTTVVGYFFVALVTDVYALPVFGYWQAFAAGSLLHIVLHPLDHHTHRPTSGEVVGARVGTVAGLVFVSSLIFTHYLEHSPTATSDIHEIHHTVDRLVEMGMLIAPILIMALLLGLGLRKVSGQSWRDAVAKIQSYFPWSVVLWLSLTFTAEVWPSLFPTGHGSLLLFLLWLAVTAASLVYQGARTFFGVLVAPVHRLGHAHHSH